MKPSAVSRPSTINLTDSPIDPKCTCYVCFVYTYTGLGANLAGVTPEKAIKLAANDLLRCVFRCFFLFGGACMAMCSMQCADGLIAAVRFFLVACIAIGSTRRL